MPKCFVLMTDFPYELPNRLVFHGHVYFYTSKPCVCHCDLLFHGTDTWLAVNPGSSIPHLLAYEISEELLDFFFSFFLSFLFFF